MNDKERKNTETLQRWYDEMWGEINAPLIPDITAETYLRHDPTGPNNRVTGEQYRDMVEMAVGGQKVTDFAYYLIAEGDFVASLGRYIRNGFEQWDWVQLFRLENAKLAETWLPGMGGNDPLAVPLPANAWTGNTVPVQPAGTQSSAKTLVTDWYQALANGDDATGLLAESIRWHDMHDANITLDPESLRQRLRTLMNDDQAQNLELFLIEQDEIVVATGMWTLGADQRSWNWVQAFRVVDNRIVEGWAPSIGGTETSIVQSPEILWEADDLPAGSTRI